MINSTAEYGNLETNTEAMQSIQLTPEDAGSNRSDPRIKSPDDLIRQMAPNKVELLSQELLTLKEQYAKDVAQWKDYEMRVQEWKKQVLSILQSKKDMPDKQKLLNEIKVFKAALQAKDQEIIRLKKLLEKSPEKKGLFQKILGS